MIGASGCSSHKDAFENEGSEATLPADEPPTEAEQLREQERRAELVRDLDPSRWPGWAADGTARFATVDPERIDSARPGFGDALPEERNFAELVLADGRQFAQQTDNYLRPRTTQGDPSELAGRDNPEGVAARVADDTDTAFAQLGTDDRITIAYGNYTKYPYRAVGTILSKSTDKTGWCSAALIGPRLALTAGHCVFDPETSAWSWNTWFSPGHRGPGTDRFPNGTPRAVVGLLSFKGWTVDHDPDHDVGFLILADEQRTAALGWFGFGWWNGSLDGVGMGMYQYPGAAFPCTASPLGDGLCNGFQYWGSRAIDNQCGNLLEHEVDTNPGSSGSPAYRWWNGGRWIMGPHAYGTTPCAGNRNKAVRLGQYKSGVACDLLSNFPSAFVLHTCN